MKGLVFCRAWRFVGLGVLSGFVFCRPGVLSGLVFCRLGVLYVGFL